MLSENDVITDKTYCCCGFPFSFLSVKPPEIANKDTKYMLEFSENNPHGRFAQECYERFARKWSKKSLIEKRM